MLLHRIWWLAATALLIILVSGCGSTGVTSGGGGSSSSSLSASQSSLQFGSILVGTPTSQTLTFTNSATSSKNVVVTAVSFGGANSSSFSLLQAPALPLTITPGQTVSVVIQALATVAGPLTATMTVTSDATSGSVNVALSATATLQTFSITGSLGTAGAGANVALSGTSSGAIVADASGNFSFGAGHPSLSGRIEESAPSRGIISISWANRRRQDGGRPVPGRISLRQSALDDSL